MGEKREYQFPPQLGETHIYFGYSGWEWITIVIGGVISMYILTITMNLCVLIPILIYSVLTCRLAENMSVFHILRRAYIYFIAEPMIYDKEIDDE